MDIINTIVMKFTKLEHERTRQKFSRNCLNEVVGHNRLNLSLSLSLSLYIYIYIYIYMIKFALACTIKPFSFQSMHIERIF